MKSSLQRIKQNNKAATILGLDIGRIYIGSAITDRNLTRPNLHKTFELDSGLESKFYPTHDELHLNEEFYHELNKTIIERKVKGLIIGYPLIENKPTNNAHFVESLMKYMYKNKIIDIPCTFVNEAFSTFEASHFLEILQINQQNYSTKFANSKKLKDQAAACIILQRFLDFYNKEDDSEDLSYINKPIISFKEEKENNKKSYDEFKQENINNEKERKEKAFLDSLIIKEKNNAENNNDSNGNNVNSRSENDKFFELANKIMAKKI